MNRDSARRDALMASLGMAVLIAVYLFADTYRQVAR